MVKKIKFIIRKIRKSDFVVSDTFYAIISFFKHGLSIVVSPKISFKNKGKINCEGVALIGIASNKVGLDLNSRGQFRIDKNAVCNLGHNVRFARGTKIFVNGLLDIGAGTYIQPHAMIVTSKQIKIGCNCAISWNVQILDTDLHNVVFEDKVQINSKLIFLGNNVWVGANSIILKGVSLGDNCIVAAGSVVTKSFPENSLIGGNPAKLIKTNISWK
jgi:acetyltransferase-like isoleucine patch superfamily enzyme